MQDTERIYRIDQLLRDRGVVSISTMLSELGVSLATFKRDLAYLRDRLHAPILFDRERGGYRFDTPGDGPRYELPGLWFSEAEAAALVTMSELLVHTTSVAKKCRPKVSIFPIFVSDLRQKISLKNRSL